MVDEAILEANVAGVLKDTKRMQLFRTAWAVATAIAPL
jgi:hypothetical protein